MIDVEQRHTERKSSRRINQPNKIDVLANTVWSPVQAVNYEYKNKDYALYVYGNDGSIWIDGSKPAEFTWKVGVILGVLGVVVLLIAIVALTR